MSLPRTKALDLTHFPLVLVTIPGSVDSSYAEVLEEDHRALFATRARYVSVSDSSRVTSMPDAKTRQRMAEWAKSSEALLRTWQVANALVVPTSLVRAGLSAIHWFAPPPVPTAIETELPAALAFVHRHARAAGLVTVGIEAYARASGVSLPL